MLLRSAKVIYGSQKLIIQSSPWVNVRGVFWVNKEAVLLIGAFSLAESLREFEGQ